MMAVHHRGLRQTQPIVIETPAGLIEISLAPRQRGKHRMVEIVTPDGCQVCIGREHALERARFLRRREDGEVEARYAALIPVTDERGVLQGVRASVLRATLRDRKPPKEMPAIRLVTPPAVETNHEQTVPQAASQ